MLQRPGLAFPKQKSAVLSPDFIVESFKDIDFDYLYAMGVKAAFIDLDGTVVSRGNYEVDPSIVAKLVHAPVKVFIATNRPKGRDLKNLIKDLRADGSVHPHGIWGKPTKKYYAHALKDKGYLPNESVMIGDRYLQDIYGSNRAGMLSVVVMKWDQPTNMFDQVLSKTENAFSKFLTRSYVRRPSAGTAGDTPAN